jgi:iron-sulfur cluster repair protein YtfE (RIC family)
MDAGEERLMLMQPSVAIVAVIFGLVTLVAGALFLVLSRARRRAAQADSRKAASEATDEEWVIRPVADAPETIASCYAVDHDDIDQLLEQFRASRTGDRPAALAMYREFKTRLERHIGWEEDILFPLFEQLTGMANNGPTVVMRAEHRQIKSFLDSIDATLQGGDASIDADESALLEVLAAHNLKEENILYPLIDRQVSAADREAVFARMLAQ